MVFVYVVAEAAEAAEADAIYVAVVEAAEAAISSSETYVAVVEAAIIYVAVFVVIH